MEEWRVIQDFPNYAVSNSGRVKRIKNNKILKLPPNRDGYLRLSLFNKSIKKDGHVHILVAEAFFGKRPFNKTVNHKNGIKKDNRLENLEYLTLRENIAHAYKNGLIIAKGEKNNRAKLTEEKARHIKYLFNLGVRNKTLSLIFNTPISTISNVCSGYSWRHI